MKISRLGAAAMLTLCLTAGAWADVFVKNRPFKGSVVGSGAAVMVEAEPMLKSLGVADYKLEGDSLTIGAKTLKAEGGLVSLKDLADAVGAKMVLNPSLGTVDVYQAAEKQADAGPSVTGSKSTAVPAWGAGTWLTSWDAAAAASKSSNKPILVNFTGSDWCGWCKRLKAEVFETEAFKSWASSRVILLECDFPRGKPQSAELKAQNQQLAEKFGVSGYPTIYFANAKGENWGRFGYADGGAQAWTKQAEQLMRKK